VFAPQAHEPRMIAVVVSVDIGSRSVSALVW
jgi:cell division ATPase FtsA